MSSDAPIAVLASGGGGLAVARRLAAALPHEDVVLLCDNAWSPWGRRPARAVLMRVDSLAGDLLAHGPKLVVLASAQGTLDGLAALRRRAGVPVVGLDNLTPAAAAAAGGRPVALVTGAGCVRGLQQRRAVRGERGGAAAAGDPWAGLAELVEAGRSASPEADALAAERLERLRAANVGAVLLACPHAASVRPAVERAARGIAVVDCAEIVLERCLRTLRRSDLLARRKRAGRLTVVSTDPSKLRALSATNG